MINPEATSRTRDGACVLARNSIGIDAGYHDAVAGTEVFARRCDGEPVRKINSCSETDNLPWRDMVARHGYDHRSGTDLTGTYADRGYRTYVGDT
jgi:hypothetical protein